MKVQYATRLSPTVIDIIRSEAVLQDISQAKFIENAVLQYSCHDKVPPPPVKNEEIGNKIRLGDLWIERKETYEEG